MKIVFFINYKREVGGGSYAMFKFAEHLAKLGHNITVFTDLKPIFYRDYYLPTNLKLVYRGGISKLFKGSSRLDEIWDWIYFKIVVKQYVRVNRDIDFVVGFLRESAIKAANIGKKYNIKTANFIFESPPWMINQLGKRFLNEYKGKFKKSWERTRKAYQETDILFPISNLTRRECIKWLKRRIEKPIYPGVEILFFNQNIKEENQVIYVGRLNEYKNINRIIEAFSKLKNPPKLVIVGTGEEEKKLKKLANKLNVLCEFKGKLNDAEKWNEIQKSMFMVFPSSFEGFGMPPAEALVCKKPCICSDIPILKEVYTSKVEYFKTGNLKDLIKKIEFLLGHSEYRKKRGEEGREYILSKYSWRKSAKRIENILKKYKNGNYYQ